ncbi:MAG TPA: hypothetical protein VGJ84_18735 [Polyangiaceae bacterium]
MAVSARVVAGLLMTAARAYVEVPPERRRPAALDGVEGPVLLGGQGASAAERRAMEPDDVRDLDGKATRPSPGTYDPR